MTYLEYVEAQSKTDCDCIDCDGEWCTWCFTHHGRKRCPVLKEVEAELKAQPRLVTEVSA